MNARITKEYRALRPFWAVALALPLAPLLFVPYGNDAAIWCLIGYAVACALLGAASFGSEWNYQTMDLLLSQPIPRQRVWRDKILILALALGTVWLAALPSLWTLPTEPRHFFGNIYGLVWMIFPVLWALAAGPYFALRTGSGIATFVFILFTPMTWMLVLSILVPPASVAGESAYGIEFGIYLVPLIVFAGAVYRLARFRFQHLETAGFSSKAIRLADWVFGLGNSSTTVSTAERGGSLGKLMRKEFHLHEVSDVIAACVTLACGVIILVRPIYNALASENFNSALPSELIVIAVVLLSLIIPITVGAASVSEERQMGLLEWHLTLPPSHRRQWLLKLVVAYGHCVVLGILLPIFLVLVAGWINPMRIRQEHFQMYNPLYLALCGGSLLLTTIALFASSLAKTTLRAILCCLGIIILTWVLAGLLMLCNAVGFMFESVLPFLYALSFKYWLLGAVVGAVFLLMLVLGYANFRRLETRLQPSIQIPLVSLALLLVMALPMAREAFQRADEMERQTGLSGRVLAAYQRSDDPQRVIAALKELLNDPARAPRAMQTLHGLASFPEALPIIVQGLSHANPDVRASATWAVGGQWGAFQTQPDVLNQIKATLFQNLQDTNVNVCFSAVYVLGDQHDHPEKLVPVLMRLLSDPKSPDYLRKGVIRNLGKLGPDAKAAIPALVKIAQSGNINQPKSMDLPRVAITALKEIDPDALRASKLEF